MGDFNDEPFDTSLVTHALSTRQRQKVLNAEIPRLWNLTWPVAGEPDGTFYFDNQPNVLDQILVNEHMATPNAPLRVEADSVEILRFPGTFTGSFRRPKPFGGMGKPVDTDGYSDHFPITVTVTVTEADWLPLAPLASRNDDASAPGSATALALAVPGRPGVAARAGAHAAAGSY